MRQGIDGAKSAEDAQKSLEKLLKIIGNSRGGPSRRAAVDSGTKKTECQDILWDVVARWRKAAMARGLAVGKFVAGPLGPRDIFAQRWERGLWCHDAALGRASYEQWYSHHAQP